VLPGGLSSLKGARLREECYACSPPEADGFVKPATAGTPGKPLTTDLRGLAALMTDRSEPTGRAEPTTEVATSASRPAMPSWTSASSQASSRWSRDRD
jgi:hypothetical protein